MDAIQLLKNRRSVRKYKDQIVPRELIEEIVKLSQFAPSWSNYQVARYNIIDNRSLIEEIANNCVQGFVYNAKTLTRANGVVVLSYVTGKSGSLKDKVKPEDVVSDNSGAWECFDAGIACLQFCLSAYAKGVATCVLGVINNDAIAQKIGLPENEKVAALIVYGYEAGEHHEAPVRKDINEILRFVRINIFILCFASVFNNWSFLYYNSGYIRNRNYNNSCTFYRSRLPVCLFQQSSLRFRYYQICP